MQSSGAVSQDRITTGEEVDVLTIGHSTLSYECFLSLLRTAGVTAVVDVRTAPYSSYLPQFNRNALRDELRLDNIAYVFLGDALGGRPSGRQFYCEGVADYEKMATTGEFGKGLDRLVEGARKYRIALMCSEQDPLDCHRCLLVGRALAGRGVGVKHILSDGQVVAHSRIEEQLLAMSGRENDDLFASLEERLAAAYRERGRKVAFEEPKSDPQGPIAAE